MRTTAWILIIFAAFIVFQGCASEEVYEDRTVYRIEPNAQPSHGPVAPDANRPPINPNTSGSHTHTHSGNTGTPVPAGTSGVPEWANRSITEIGEGAADPNRPRAQAKLLAFRAARLDAVRKLSERVVGLRIDSSTTVKDFIAESDDIRAQVDAKIRDFQEVERNFDEHDGIARVRVQLQLFSVWEVIRERRRIK